MVPGSHDRAIRVSGPLALLIDGLSSTTQAPSEQTSFKYLWPAFAWALHRGPLQHQLQIYTRWQGVSD